MLLCLSGGSNLHELFFELHENKMCQLIKTSSDWLMLCCFPWTLIGTETPRRVAPASCLASSWLLLLLRLCVQHVSVVFVVIYDLSVFLGDCCEFVRCFLVLFKRPGGNVNRSEVFDDWWEGWYIEDICLIKSRRRSFVATVANVDSEEWTRASLQCKGSWPFLASRN